MKNIIALVIAGIVANITGHGIWIAALVNFSWLLFKDVMLFPWFWLVYPATVFVVSVVLILWNFFNLKNKT